MGERNASLILSVRTLGFWMYSYFKSLKGLIFLRTLYANHKQTQFSNT